MRTGPSTADRRRAPVGVLGLAVVAGLFFALPFVGVLNRADWANLPRDLTSARSVGGLRLSLVCSLLATAVSLRLGTPMARVLPSANSISTVPAPTIGWANWLIW